MQVTFDIPEEFAAQLLATGKDPAREALELLAIEGYRARRLNESEVRRMLGYGTRMQVHALLANHDVCLHYSLADLETDCETGRYREHLTTEAGEAHTESPAEAVAQIRELRKGLSLNGLSIKELINEGRRY